MTKSRRKSRLFLFGIILFVGIAIGFVLCTNYQGNVDITEPLEDGIQTAIMENAVEDLCPAEGEAPENICPAEMQSEETTDSGIYILIRTKNNNFEINL